MKVPFIVLLIGASALLLWQCYKLLDQHSSSKLKDWGNINGPVDQHLFHDEKYGYFLQITDTHLDDHYTEGATLKSGCHSMPEKHVHSKHTQLCGPMGVPGIRMDAPSTLIEHTLNWIQREWRDKLDFVIWTGDNSRHDWDEQHPRKESKVLELNHLVTKMVSNLFCSSPEHPRAIPVVPVIGNNDVQPHNYIHLNDDVLHFFEKLWNQWIPKKQRKDFLEGGYFAVDVALGLRNQLRKARHDGVKIYVIGHVPPSPRDFFKSCMTDYMVITANYSDVVFGHFYGHLNMDHFLLYDRRGQEIHNSEAELPRLENPVDKQHDKISIQRNAQEYVDWLKGMYKEINEFEYKHPNRHEMFRHQKAIFTKKFEPVVVVHVAPSVFPIYMSSVRIYRYEHRNSRERGANHEYGTLLGYSQFVANISRYNEEGGHKDPKPPLNFDLEYDTNSLYGLPDLSVDAYMELADVLTQNDTNSQKMWNTFCRNIFLQTLNSTFDSF
ncbi:hypothetical protein BD408DRAFT_432155 [Parasitella parasitica]|nr:hypothetical protein BD408DRAFT_432155 [Parasitella parasitica]